MPIEIKELNIKVNVGNSTHTESNQEVFKRELVTECVEAIMEIIDKQKER